MDAPLELQDEVLQLDARQFNYRVVHDEVQKKRQSVKLLTASFVIMKYPTVEDAMLLPAAF